MTPATCKAEAEAGGQQSRSQLGPWSETLSQKDEMANWKPRLNEADERTQLKDNQINNKTIDR